VHALSSDLVRLLSLSPSLSLSLSLSLSSPLFSSSVVEALIYLSHLFSSLLSPLFISSVPMDSLGTAWEAEVAVFKKRLRPVQQKEFICSAKCAGDANLTEAEYEACLRRCGAPLERLGNAYLREANSFQVHTQRERVCCTSERKRKRKRKKEERTICLLPSLPLPLSIDRQRT
jgi:hypothetical protein